MERTIKFKHEITSLEIKSSINVILTSDPATLVSFFGAKKSVKRIRVREKNGRLVLRKSLFAPFGGSPFIVVSTPKLKRIKVQENAQVESSGVLNLPSLQVVVNADAKVRLHIAGESVATYLKGAGSVNIQGDYHQTEVRRDQFGWCQVHYQRQADALVADPH